MHAWSFASFGNYGSLYTSVIQLSRFQAVRSAASNRKSRLVRASNAFSLAGLLSTLLNAALQRYVAITSRFYIRLATRALSIILTVCKLEQAMPLRSHCILILFKLHVCYALFQQGCLVLQRERENSANPVTLPEILVFLASRRAIFFLFISRLPDLDLVNGNF